LPNEAADAVSANHRSGSPFGFVNQAGHRIRVQFGPLGNASLVSVLWPSLHRGRAASTVQETRERRSIAVRHVHQPLKSDPGARLKTDRVSALLVALQLVMLVLSLTGQIRYPLSKGAYT
jgi:hypothetical protein